MPLLNVSLQSITPYNIPRRIYNDAHYNFIISHPPQIYYHNLHQHVTCLHYYRV